MENPQATPESPRRGPAPVRRSLRGGALSPARARILEHVQAQSGTVGVEDVAVAFDQHPNTVRGHLDALVGAGILIRERAAAEGRGRPAWRYRADADQREPDPRVREYAALAGALAAHIATHSDDPGTEAHLAGARWGAALVAARGVESSTDAVAHQRVVTLLAELDFTPRVERGGRAVVLTTCPILDVASAHPEVVCAVHEGMVAGALTSLGAPSEGVALEPFAAPDGCLLTLPAARRSR